MLFMVNPYLVKITILWNMIKLLWVRDLLYLLIHFIHFQAILNSLLVTSLNNGIMVIGLFNAQLNLLTKINISLFLFVIFN